MWVKSNSYNWTWWGWWGGAELDMKQMDWFKTWKAVCQGCILSPCLFNLHAEDITFMAESEEELKSLMRVKEESEKAGLILNT